MIETKVLLEDKISVGNKSFREIYIGDIYRNVEVRIAGAKHKPPVPSVMYYLIKEFYNNLNSNTEFNPIELAAWTHAEFVKIHPFVDGNGRTSRLIMNYQLMRNRFLPVSINEEDRLEYFNLLEEYAVNGNLTPFADFIAEREEQQFDEYLSIFRENQCCIIVNKVDKIGNSNNNELVFSNFDEALALHPDAHPLFHSDRGFQYTNKTFRAKLIAAGMEQSMSRVGRCIDNGPMEGFWGILKSEMYYIKKFTSEAELHQAIENYIYFYNTRRYQKRLRCMTPMEFHHAATA